MFNVLFFFNFSILYIILLVCIKGLNFLWLFVLIEFLWTLVIIGVSVYSIILTNTVFIFFGLGLICFSTVELVIFVSFIYYYL